MAMERQTMKLCDNCNNYVWGDKKTPIPQVCLECRYVEVEGEKVPHNWKPIPMANGDRIRKMSDEELAFSIFDVIVNGVRPWCDFSCRKEEEPGFGCQECMFKWVKRVAEAKDG